MSRETTGYHNGVLDSCVSAFGMFLRRTVTCCFLVLISGCSLWHGQRMYPLSGPLPSGDQVQEDFAQGKIAAEKMSNMWLVFLDPDTPGRPVNWQDLEHGTVVRISDEEEQREIIRLLHERADVDDSGGRFSAATGVVVAREAETGRYLYFGFVGYETHMWISPPSSPGEFGTHGMSNSVLWAHLKNRYSALTAYRDLSEKSDKWIRTYYHNGGLRGEFPLRNGKPHGMARLLHPDGTINLLTPYVDGVQEGTGWSFVNGRLITEEPYRDGKLHGVFRVFSGNGLVSEESWFWNGEPVTKEEFRERSQRTQ